MTNVRASGIESGKRHLNGPQTTGREYRNLSQPSHGMTRDDDVAVPVRDGINLLADVHRPAEPGRYPVLIAASPSVHVKVVVARLMRQTEFYEGCRLPP